MYFTFVLTGIWWRHEIEYSVEASGKGHDSAFLSYCA